MEIGEAIIHNLDEDGLLRTSLEEIANMGPYPMPEVDRALTVIQALDPPGVAARTLTECLRLQLKHLGLEGSPADVMVRDCLKQLQSHQYPEIGRLMGLSPDEVSHHLEIVKGLDPKPGNRYSPNKSAYILPDVFVVKEGDDYKIVLNDDGLPGGGQQVHAHPAGGVRAALLLPQRHYLEHGRGHQLRVHQGPHPEDDRGGGRCAPPLRLADSRGAGSRRAAPGPPHGGEVPRGAPDPSLQPAQGGALRSRGPTWGDTSECSAAYRAGASSDAFRCIGGI